MMEWPVAADGMNSDTDLAIHGLLKPLSLVDMETLLAALDPRLDGFGSGPSCLDDACAFLARLASGTKGGEEDGPVADTEAMAEWIEIWRSAGGNRQTLRLLVQTVMAERMGLPSAEAGQEGAAGPHEPGTAAGGGPGPGMT